MQIAQKLSIDEMAATFWLCNRSKLFLASASRFLFGRQREKKERRRRGEREGSVSVRESRK